MPELSALFTCGRYALVGYAAIASVLTTACLALQAMTRFDRWGDGRRASRGAASHPGRSLFIKLDTPR